MLKHAAGRWADVVRGAGKVPALTRAGNWGMGRQAELGTPAARRMLATTKSMGRTNTLLEGLKQGKMGDMYGKDIDAVISQRVRTAEAGYFMQEDNARLRKPNRPEDYPDPEPSEFLMKPKPKKARVVSKEQQDKTLMAEIGAEIEQREKARVLEEKNTEEVKEKEVPIDMGQWLQFLLVSAAFAGGATVFMLIKLARDPEKRVLIDARAPGVLTPLRTLGLVDK